MLSIYPTNILSLYLLLLFLLLLLSLNNEMVIVESLYVYEPCCHDFVHRGASFGPQLPFSPNSGLKLELAYLPSSGCNDYFHNEMLKENDIAEAEMGFGNRILSRKFDGKAVLVPRK